MRFWLFRYLFYRQYQLNLGSADQPRWLRLWGEDPVWASMSGYTAVWACQFMNVFSIIDFVDDFSGLKMVDKFINRWDTLEFVGIALISFIVSILFTFGPRQHVEQILAEFKGFDDKEKLRRDLYLWIYVIGSFLIFLISFMANPVSWHFGG